MTSPQQNGEKVSEQTISSLTCSRVPIPDTRMMRASGSAPRRGITKPPITPGCRTSRSKSLPSAIVLAAITHTHTNIHDDKKRKGIDDGEKRKGYKPKARMTPRTPQRKRLPVTVRLHGIRSWTQSQSIEDEELMIAYICRLPRKTRKKGKERGRVWTLNHSYERKKK